MEDTSYRSMLKAENMKLKKQIEDLQNTVMRITGSIKIFPSGISGSGSNLNDKISEILSTASGNIRIITPKVGTEYERRLVDISKKGTKIQIIINDRRFLTPDEERKSAFPVTFAKNKSPTAGKTPINYAKIYDQLKTTSGIDLVNNPNVKFLLILTSNDAIFSAGWLERSVLDNTILLGAHIQDKKKIKEIEEIYSNLLPSFMR
ncbi:MAG: hypothetical protein GY870_07700 [archaeon]|nr:hypothetical protein [archaeon]